MFNRDAAISLEIKDPDDPEQEHQIKSMIAVNGQLLIFSTTGIFRVLTADTIDPEKAYPDTRHSYEKLYSLGTNNGLIARTIIQFKDILDLAIPEADRKEAVLNKVWENTKLLLECEKSLYHIYKHTVELMPKCDEIVEANKGKSNIPPLSKVPDLNTHVYHFLMNGKLLLIETHGFLNEFFAMPFDGKNAAHFDKHRLWIKNKLGEDHPLFRLLADDEAWLRIISECSNAIRHPENGQKVQIENITLKPGNKFSNPAWKYDLSKKGLGVQDYYTDLIHNFGVYLHNLATFFEEVLVLSIQELLKENPILDIYKKPPERISAECPTLYEIQLKLPHEPWPQLH